MLRQHASPNRGICWLKCYPRSKQLTLVSTSSVALIVYPTSHTPNQARTETVKSLFDTLEYGTESASKNVEQRDEGCQLRFLPSYSPVLIPVERASAELDGQGAAGGSLRLPRGHQRDRRRLPRHYPGHDRRSFDPDAGFKL